MNICRSVIIAGLVSLAVSSATLYIAPTSVQAALTSESCFATTGTATKTITNYYAHEGNDAANPACPRGVEIPAMIGGVPVTGIGMAFNLYSSNATSFASKSLTSVVIPSTVTTIGSDAFARNQLTALELPDTVTTIGNGAFKYNQFTTLPSYFSESFVTSIPNQLFAYNEFSSVIIPPNITTIGGGAFTYNTLESIVIPDTVSSVGSYAFSDNYIASAQLSAAMTTIPDGLFYANQLESIAIPDSITSIGEYAFAFNKITEVRLGREVASMDRDSFLFQSPYGRDLDYGSASVSIWSSNPTVVQTAFDNIWFARLYTADASNPYGLKDEVHFEGEWMGYDGNENGHTNDILGGHLINPSSVEYRFVDTQGVQLRSPVPIVGYIDAEHALNDYLVRHAPAMTEPAAPYLPTPAEQQAYRDALSVYYRSGQSVQYHPPAVNGYVTPQSVTVPLDGVSNEYTFVYASRAEATPLITDIIWQDQRLRVVGTYNPDMVNGLKVQVADTVYVLGESPFLTVHGSTWTLDLTGSSDPRDTYSPGRYVVRVLGTTASGEVLEFMESVTISEKGVVARKGATKLAQTGAPAVAVMLLAMMMLATGAWIVMRSGDSPDKRFDI